MDRPIAKEIQRNRSIRTYIIVAIIVASVVAGVFLFRNSLRPTLNKNRLRVATAEQGPLKSTLTASGEVIPEFEQVLTSPIRASLEDVLVSVGDQLSPGQQLMELDKAQPLLEYAKMQSQLAIRQNNMEKLKLRLAGDLRDLKVRDTIKLLKIKRLKSELETEKDLLEMGGGVKEDLERIKLNLKIAQLERAQILNEMTNAEATIQADIKDEALQMTIQRQNMEELERKLQLANIQARRAGVLTWVYDKIGSSINEGEILARIADLRSFKIVGKCSDAYAEMLSIGMPAIIDVNGIKLEASVSNISPTVENNTIRFEAQLNDNNHSSLRPNMKVEIYVVTASKNEAITVANGPAFKGRKKQFIYILKGNEAIRREVEIGLTNFDLVEITRNVEPGEKVIISDMSDYDHLASILLK